MNLMPSEWRAVRDAADLLRGFRTEAAIANDWPAWAKAGEVAGALELMLEKRERELMDLARTEGVDCGA